MQRHILNIAIVLIIIGFLTIIGSLIYIPKYVSKDIGDIGSFVGGVVGSLWSVASVLFLLYTILIQQKQIQRMNEDSDSNSKDTKQLLDYHLRGLQYTEFKNSFWTIIDIAKGFLNTFHYLGEIGNDAFDKFYDKHKDSEQLIIHPKTDNQEELRKYEQFAISDFDSKILSDLMREGKLIYGFFRNEDYIENSIFQMGKISVFPIEIIDEIVSLLLKQDESTQSIYKYYLYSILTEEQRNFVYNWYLYSKREKKVDLVTRYFIDNCFKAVDFPIYTTSFSDIVEINHYLLNTLNNDTTKVYTFGHPNLPVLSMHFKNDKFTFSARKYDPKILFEKRTM